MTLLRGLYSVASIRRIETEWLAQTAPGTLMARAAVAVADQATRMLRRMPPDTAVLLLVGPGNNGGDALQAGLLLSRRGFDVRALAVASILGAPPRAADAAAAWRAWHEDGARLEPIEDIAGSPDAAGSLPSQPALAIDGLFGIGLTRALPSSLTALLDWLDRTRTPVLAIDVPSGIDADTGAAVRDGRFVSASVTVTMIADKRGLHTGTGLSSSGRVLVAPLTDPRPRLPEFPAADSLPPSPVASLCGTLSVRGVTADSILLDARAVDDLLPRRGIDAHKGTSGDVLVVGGRLGMAGAARLAARGALGAGAGKVWIAGDPGARDAADPSRPEVMRSAIAAGAPLPPRVRVVAIGCGLGQDRQARQYLLSVIRSRALMVCDADALNLLAATPRLARLVRQRSAATILTPHPLEAARLLAWSTARVQSDRIAAALELASRFNAVAVLKGPGTIVAGPSGRHAINASGHPVLATGGTGDVLAGIIAALAAGLKSGPRAAGTGPGAADAADALVAADALPAAAAACAGVWLHGAAGDLAARRLGPAGVPAGVIADLLPAVMQGASTIDR